MRQCNLFQSISQSSQLKIQVNRAFCPLEFTGVSCNLISSWNKVMLRGMLKERQINTLEFLKRSTKITTTPWLKMYPEYQRTSFDKIRKFGFCLFISNIFIIVKYNNLFHLYIFTFTIACSFDWCKKVW